MAVPPIDSGIAPVEEEVDAGVMCEQAECVRIRDVRPLVAVASRNALPDHEKS
jgi:hypothetical protein